MEHSLDTAGCEISPWNCIEMCYLFRNKNLSCYLNKSLQLTTSIMWASIIQISQYYWDSLFWLHLFLTFMISIIQTVQSSRVQTVSQYTSLQCIVWPASVGWHAVRFSKECFNLICIFYNLPITICLIYSWHRPISATKPCRLLCQICWSFQLVSFFIMPSPHMKSPFLPSWLPPTTRLLVLQM